MTLEDLLIETMPFSSELVDWCKNHKAFMNALKIIYCEKYISLGAIVTSFSPDYPNDEVIGIYVYDYQRKFPLFKQDFIINKNRLNNEFILFTRNNKVGCSKYVKDINEFYSTYGKNNYYVKSHHLSFEELPNEIKQRALGAIAFAEKMKGGTKVNPTQEQIFDIFCQVKALKNGIWVEKTKL
jgi:hypothetical protein